MKKITDEILNDYIDNLLNSASIQELKTELEQDEDSIKKLKALKVVDSSLKNIDVIPAPEGFTNRIMSIITRGSKKAASKVSYFFISIIGLFTLLIFTVLGIAFNILAESIPSSENGSSINKISEYMIQFTSMFQNFFKNQNITTIGITLTILLLISGYYLLESHREFKDKLKNFS